MRLARPLSVALLLAAACARSARAPSVAVTAAAPSGHGELRQLIVHARSLEGNLLGDPAARNVAVYLPPSYRTAPARRYPVVYLLHGYLSAYDVWTTGKYQGFRLDAAMDSLIAAHTVREMIVVAPDAGNAYGGSFYTNSAVAGNWEDFVTHDLVAWTDSTFRTRTQPESRAIAGHSMGGYGAIKLAMRHPDLYGVVYALSPCCLGVDTTGTPSPTTAPVYRLLAGLTGRDALQKSGFYAQVLVAMGAAFSPHAGRAPFQVDLPFEPGPNGLVLQRAAADQWRVNSPLNTLAASLPALRRLRAIGFDAGTRDDFREIPPTVRALDAALTAAGITHKFELYDGTHSDHIRERLETRALPFLSQALVP